MRRLLLIAMFLCAAIPALPSPFQEGKAKRPEKIGSYPRMVNPVDFGAIPNDDKPDDAAFQRAIDALGPGRPMGQRVAGVIVVPPGTFDFAAPVFMDRDYTTLRGTEQGLTILRSMQEVNTPIMFVGLRRKWGKKQIGREHFIDSFDVLDRTAASKPGALWGIHPKGASATFWDGALAFGKQDGYASTRVLTVEWAAADPKGGELAPGMYMGMGNGAEPGPWCVGELPGYGTNVWFRTSEQDTDKHIFWNFVFPAAHPGKKGPHRRAFTIDLDKGKVAAWDDGVRVACSGVVAASPFDPKVSSPPFKAGLKFARNDLLPFCLGHVNYDLVNLGSRTPVDSDYIFHGVRVSSGAIYEDSEPGERQRRLDGNPVNDFNSYLAVETTTLGLVRQTVDPMSVRGGGILLRSFDGPASGSEGYNCGIMLPVNSQGGGNSNIAQPVVKNISFVSRSRLGTPLVLGSSFNLKIEHVDTSMGWHGIGCYEMGASWTTKIDDVKCDFATDAGISLLGHLVEARGIDITYPGTTAMRLRGAGGTLENIFVGQAPDRCETLFKIPQGQLGQALAFRNVLYDGEGFWCPTVAVFWIENNNEVGPTSIDIEKLGFGRIGPDAVIVKLLSMGKAPQQKPARCSLRDSYFQNERFRAIFEVDGDLWHYDADHLVANSPLPPLKTPRSSASRAAMPHLTTEENDAKLKEDRKRFHDKVNNDARLEKERGRIGKKK